MQESLNFFDIPGFKDVIDKFIEKNPILELRRADGTKVGVDMRQFQQNEGKLKPIQMFGINDGSTINLGSTGE